MRKDEVVAWFKLLSRHSSGGLYENYEKFEDNRCPGGDCKRAPSGRK